MNTAAKSRADTERNVGAVDEHLGDLLLDRLAARAATLILARLGDGPVSATKRLLTMEQAGEYLGRSRESMQHLVSSGKLPTVRSDRRVFLDLKDLDEWIEANKVRGTC
jgi:excisionase family DNA binding protein